jgi:DNA-binding winged helix-turn-helix (wHTH) protein
VDGAFRLGDWLVEPRLNTLASGDRDVRVEPKVMAVLVCLADRAGDVVAKEELLRAVWPDTFVTDDVLTHAISELRKVLADDARTPRFIQTIPKGGYRLIAPVARVGVPAPSLDAGGVTPRTAARRPLWNRAIALGGAVALTLLGVVAIRSRTVIPPAPHVMRLAIDNRSTGPLMAHHMSQLPSFRLSPDGTRLVFIVGPALNNPIYKRALDQTEPTPIAGTEGGIVPFFSPDGAWLGFAAKGPPEEGLARRRNAGRPLRRPLPSRGDLDERGRDRLHADFQQRALADPAGGGTPVELTALDRTRNENTRTAGRSRFPAAAG